MESINVYFFVGAVFILIIKILMTSICKTFFQKLIKLLALVIIVPSSQINFIYLFKKTNEITDVCWK